MSSNVVQFPTAEERFKQRLQRIFDLSGDELDLAITRALRKFRAAKGQVHPLDAARGEKE